LTLSDTPRGFGSETTLAPAPPLHCKLVKELQISAALGGAVTLA
jgi:hypothetical protein